MEDSEILKHLLEEVVEKVELGELETWTDKNYRKLSEIISESSGINVSHNTLKRLFGKSKTGANYSPQEATKDALARYLDHKDWYEYTKSKRQQSSPKKEEEEFKESGDSESQITEIPPEAEKEPSDKHPPPPTIIDVRTKVVSNDPPADEAPAPIQEHSISEDSSSEEKSSKPRLKLILIALGIMVFIGTIIFVAQRTGSTRKINTKLIAKSGEAPFTAILAYKSEENNSDSIFAIFEDNVLEKIHLPAEHQQITHVYKRPGFYNVVVVNENADTLSKEQILVSSPKWTLYEGQLNNVHLNQQVKSHFYSKEFNAKTYSYFKNFNMTTDELSLSFIAKGGSNGDIDENIRLRGNCMIIDEYDEREKIIIANVVGDKGEILFTLSEACCFGDLIEIIGQKAIDGKYNNLSNFGLALNNWNMFKILVHNKHISFTCNEQIIYTDHFSKSIGQLMGINLIVVPDGEVSKVTINQDTFELN